MEERNAMRAGSLTRRAAVGLGTGGVTTALTARALAPAAAQEATPAAIERSDTCAVPAAAVVAEAMVGLVLANAVLERFGGDSLTDLRARVADTGARVARRLSRRPAATRA